MRINGKITHWNRQKAYGFITPESGGKQVFIHIKAFENKEHRPAIDQEVTFVMSTDRQGRPCAANVTLQGEKSAGGSRPGGKKVYIAVAVVIIVIVGLAIAFGLLPLPGS